MIKNFLYSPKNIVCFLVILVCGVNARAQRFNSDSLSRVWNNTAANDTVRMKALAQLAKSYLKTNPDTVLFLSETLYGFAASKKNYSYQGLARRLQGNASQRLNNPVKALALFKEDLQLQKKANSVIGTIEALNSVGVELTSMSEYMEASEYVRQALQLAEKAGYKEGIMASNNSLGTINQQLGQYLESINYYEKALSMAYDLKNNGMQGRTLVNIGNVYNMRGDVEGALKYYGKGRKILEETNDKRNLSNVLNNIGTLYMDTKLLDSAIFYLKKGMALREEMNDLLMVATSLSNLGEVYLKQKKINEAKECFERAIQISKELGATAGGITGQLLNLSLLAQETGDLAKATRYTNEALAEAERSGSLIDKVACYESKYQITRAEGKYKESLEWHENFMQGRDSLIGEENQKALTEQQFRNEYAHKAKADSLRMEEEKKITTLKITQQQTQRNYLLSGVVFLIAGLLFALNRFAVTRRQKNVIERQKKEVEKQKKVVEAKQQEILDSIRYAKRIQNSLMPNESYILKTIKRLRE